MAYNQLAIDDIIEKHQLILPSNLLKEKKPSLYLSNS